MNFHNDTDESRETMNKVDWKDILQRHIQKDANERDLSKPTKIPTYDYQKVEQNKNKKINQHLAEYHSNNFE